MGMAPPSDGTNDTTDPSSKLPLLAPGLLYLINKSVEYRKKILTAKTQFKKDFYTKKLKDNNKKVYRLAELYNTVAADQVDQGVR